MTPKQDWSIGEKQEKEEKYWNRRILFAFKAYIASKVFNKIHFIYISSFHYIIYILISTCCWSDTASVWKGCNRSALKLFYSGVELSARVVCRSWSQARHQQLSLSSLYLMTQCADGRWSQGSVNEDSFMKINCSCTGNCDCNCLHNKVQLVTWHQQHWSVERDSDWSVYSHHLMLADWWSPQRMSPQLPECPPRLQDRCQGRLVEAWVTTGSSPQSLSLRWLGSLWVWESLVHNNIVSTLSTDTRSTSSRNTSCSTSWHQINININN